MDFRMKQFVDLSATVGILLSLLFVGSSAATSMTEAEVTSKALRMAIKIEPLNLRLEGETAASNITSYTVGYGSTYSGCVTLQSGASAVLHFDFNVSGTTTTNLSTLEGNFTKSMNATQRDAYESSKSKYGGGFESPILGWLGFTANAEHQDEQIQESKDYNQNYNGLMNQVGKTLEDMKSNQMNIKGDVTAFGVSLIKTTACAYIQVATIKFGDNTTLHVFNPDSTPVAADSSGNTMQKDIPKKIKITPY